MTAMNLRPSEIYYSQNNISNRFRRRSLHSRTFIGKTLDDLCEGRCSIENIPKISVMKKDNKWFTADNRRLWVFENLERLGKCTTVPVIIGTIPENKFTTCNGGVSINVRDEPGGLWHTKPDVVEIKRQTEVHPEPSPLPSQPIEEQSEICDAVTSVQTGAKDANAEQKEKNAGPSDVCTEPPQDAIAVNDKMEVGTQLKLFPNPCLTDDEDVTQNDGIRVLEEPLSFGEHVSIEVLDDFGETQANHANINAKGGQVQKRGMAQHFNLSKRVISRYGNRFLQTRRVQQGSRLGCPIYTTARQKRYHGNMSRTRFHFGLHFHRLAIRPVLMRNQRLARQRWVRNRVNWQLRHLKTILFTDMTRFRFDGGSVLVWAGICIDGRTDLHVIEGGTLTGTRYRDEILHPLVRPIAGEIGNGFILMEDNLGLHNDREVNEYLQTQTVVRMDFPSHSPDLNPIKQIWDMLGRQVGKRQPLPANC